MSHGYLNLSMKAFLIAQQDGPKPIGLNTLFVPRQKIGSGAPTHLNLTSHLLVTLMHFHYVYDIETCNN